MSLTPRSGASTTDSKNNEHILLTIDSLLYTSSLSPSLSLPAIFPSSTSLIKPRPRPHHRQDHTQITRRDIQILTRNRHKHRPVRRRITRKGTHVRLHRARAGPVHVEQRRVRHVQLARPQAELGRGGRAAAGGDVAVVRADGGAGGGHVEVDDAARVAEGLGAVVGHGGGTVGVGALGVEAEVARGDVRGAERVGAGDAVVGAGLRDLGRVGLVEDGQGGEVLPREARLVGGTAGDVGCQQGPSPGLRDADFEPDGHGEEAIELAEDHLLSGFGRDGLE